MFVTFQLIISELMYEIIVENGQTMTFAFHKVT